jgi:uncharacterized protein YcfL
MKKVIIICGALLFIGCASRKVDVNKSESKGVIKSDSTTKIAEEKKELIITKKAIEITEFNYEPIDSKSEFIVDGKTYKNVRISYKKQSDNTIVKEDRKESKKQDIVVKKKEELKGKDFIKKIDKKANYFIYLWFLLIPVFYVIYKRFKI